LGKFDEGEKDLSDEERPGRSLVASIDEILAYGLGQNPDTTARRLAASLGISPQTVITHLHEGLVMKRFHLRWVPIPELAIRKLRGSGTLT
jgi:hypothetical protein